MMANNANFEHKKYSATYLSYYTVKIQKVSQNIATFVFEMIIFNKGSVLRFISMIKGAKYIFNRYLIRKNTKYSKSEHTLRKRKRDTFCN